MSPVQLFWRNSPFTLHHRRSFCGSADFVRSRQPRSHRREGVRALSLGPLAAHFLLKRPLRKIAERRISRHAVQRLTLVHIRSRPADHHRQFHLVIQFRRTARNHHIIERAAPRARRLHEKRRAPSESPRPAPWRDRDSFSPRKPISMGGSPVVPSALADPPRHHPDSHPPPTPPVPPARPTRKNPHRNR